MVIRGMSISLPWFALINICFSSMILLRGILFNEDMTSGFNEKNLVHTIDISSFGILLISGLLLLISRKKSAVYSATIGHSQPVMVMVLLLFHCTLDVTFCLSSVCIINA